MQQRQDATGRSASTSHAPQSSFIAIVASLSSLARDPRTCSHAAQRPVATLDSRRPETHESVHAWRGARPRVSLFMPLKSSRGDSSVWEMLLRESGVAKLDYYA